MSMCAIGYFTSDNTIRAVLCENEGYIDGVGFTLIKNYSDDWSVVESLVNRGHIEYLGDTEDDTQYDLDNPAYFEYDNEHDFLKHSSDLGCEYTYLFLEEIDIGQPAMWNVARPGTDFVPIVDRMMNSEECYIQGVA